VIHEFEQELAGLSEQLASPASDWGPAHYVELSSRHGEIAAKLEKLYKEWEEAAAAGGK